jgi:pimeloyl-ACP methyl ester carboxylesterase
MSTEKSPQSLIPGWFREPGAEGTIVFIHGVRGSAAKSWGESGSSWPDLIQKDPRLDGAGIFLAQYESSFGSRDFGFAEASRQVLTQLEVPDAVSGRRVLDSKRLLIIAHSAGGIVARLMLTKHGAQFSNTELGLCLVGSPSMGSGYANVLHLTKLLFGNRQALQLKWDSDFLRSLDTDFKALLAKAGPHFFGRELVEHRGPLLGCFPKVVGYTSATRYFADPVMIPGVNHGQLVRPKTITDSVHQELVRLWDELKSGPIQVPTVTAPMAAAKLSADQKLFAELDSIMTIEHVDRWDNQAWGIPFENDNVKPLRHFESRAKQPNCIFHDAEVNAAHGAHLNLLRNFTNVLDRRSFPVDSTRHNLNRDLKDRPSLIRPGLDAFSDVVDEVEDACEAWLSSYREFIQTAKRRLIV